MFKAMKVISLKIFVNFLMVIYPEPPNPKKNSTGGPLCLICNVIANEGVVLFPL